jgi:Mg/Co/Ni transporter MgtE
MGDDTHIVITTYGHNKAIDHIAVNLFDESTSDYYNAINNLELPGEAWVLAKIVPHNKQYVLGEFVPLKFDILLKLDNRAIQKMLRECDSQELAKALKFESEAIQQRIFDNLSKRSAEMLKENMDYLGPIKTQDIKEAQRKIISIIRHLGRYDQIIIPYQLGEAEK